MVMHAYRLRLRLLGQEGVCRRGHGYALVQASARRAGGSALVATLDSAHSSKTQLAWLQHHIHLTSI